MNKDERNAILIGVAVLVMCITLALALTAVSAYNEARAYQRVTGKTVTTWDAMWLDLRVQESPR